MDVYYSPTRCIFMNNMKVVLTNIHAMIVLLCGVWQPDASLIGHYWTFALLFQWFLLFFVNFKQNYHNSMVSIANCMLYLEWYHSGCFSIGFAVHLLGKIVLQPDPHLFGAI